MADIRINSLPSTATSFNTDDYIAIDGASGGTRKMLAATLPLTDVTLGSTSGPSVKSSLSARAPRQGLVFDGTTGGSFTLTSAPSGSWSTDQTALIPTANPSSAIGFFAIGGTYSTDATYAMYISAGGALVVEQNTAAPSSYRTASVSGFRAAYSGKTVRIATTVSSGTLIIYVNGVSASYSEGTTGGSPPAWGATLGSATSYFGKLTASQYYFNSELGPLYIYNRALSASEVVSLYESGAPKAADYNTASNTNIIGDVSRNSNFSAGATDWTGVNGGTAAVVSSALNVDTTTSAYGGCSLTNTYWGGSPTVNKPYNITFTVSNWAVVSGSPTIEVRHHSSTVVVIGTITGNGTFRGTFSPTSSGGSIIILDNTGSGARATFTIDDVVITRAGLLLAPDAAQAGGGLVWYDTSGNAANITLPASGVSWNVPFGNNIAASGTNQNLTLNASGTGSILLGSNGVARGQIAGVNKNGSTGPASSGTTTNAIWRVSNVSNSLVMDIGLNGAATPYPGYIQVSDYSNLATSYPLALNPNGGVVLVNTTANSGNGAIQLATHITSAGGIGFGSDLSLSRFSTSGLAINTTASTLGLLAIGNSGVTASSSAGLHLHLAVNDGYLWNRQNGPLYFGTNNTLALTLDSSQNATFAGTVEVSKSAASTNLNALTLRNSAYNVGESTSIVLTHGTGSGKPVTSISSYLPGSNQSELVFYTSNTSAVSTEALRINGSQNATFAGKITAGTWASGTAEKLQANTTANNYAGFFANTASSGNGYALRLHTNGTTSGDYPLFVSSGAGAGSLIFGVTGDGNATFAAWVKAGTAYGTAKSIEVNEAFVNQAQNTTKTVTVALPGGANGATFVLDVGAYGNSGTGYGSLLVKGAGYLGSSTTYDAAEIVKANSGSVTVSSVTKGNNQLTFTVINTAGTVSISVKLTATAGDNLTTIPAITIA